MRDDLTEREKASQFAMQIAMSHSMWIALCCLFNEGQAVSQDAAPDTSSSKKKKNFQQLFLCPKLKESHIGELFHSVTSDLTRRTNLAIRSLIPQLESNGDFSYWQTIKDIQATSSLTVQSRLVFAEVKLSLTEDDF